MNIKKVTEQEYKQALRIVAQTPEGKTLLKALKEKSGFDKVDVSYTNTGLDTGRMIFNQGVKSVWINLIRPYLADTEDLYHIEKLSFVDEPQVKKKQEVNLDD